MLFLIIGLMGLSVDSKGNFYVTESLGNRVRLINGTTMEVTTVAGCQAEKFKGIFILSKI